MLKAIKTLIICILVMMLFTVVLFFFFLFTPTYGLEALETVAKLVICIRVFGVEVATIIVLLGLIAIIKKRSK